jgi:histidine triad (HIT) family protein
MVSIFTKIIQGDIPSYKVYEDDLIYAFLSIEPFHLGHTLVVPKEEIWDILDMPSDLYAHLMNVSQSVIAPAIKMATGATRIGFMVEGFGITDHAHLHLIPLYESGDMNPAKAHKETDDNMAMIAKKIQSSLLLTQ